VVRLLADRRDELNQEHRRVTNRLHRLLRDLVAGGAPTPLTVEVASRLPGRTRPRTAADQQPKALAHELLADLRRLDRQLTANRTRCQELLASRPTRLLDVFGIGAVLAVKLIGHSGAITRFHSPDHYPSSTGTAPVDTSSAPNTRQRVNRSGNRALNTAIHLVARTRPADPVPDAPTTNANSPKARPPTRPSGPSSARSSRSSTGAWSPTTTPATPTPPAADIQPR
jgi:transposase